MMGHTFILTISIFPSLHEIISLMKRDHPPGSDHTSYPDPPVTNDERYKSHDHQQLLPTSHTLPSF